MTDEQIEAMEPCPFCGGSNASAYEVKGSWSTLCVGCGGEGPEEESEADAIAAWNRRAAPTKGDVLMDAERYRFLRSRAIYHGTGMDAQPSSPWCVIGTSHESSRPCDGDELDAAIDAALESMEGK